MHSDEELAAFIDAHTALAAPAGCPEIKLHTATAMTSLMQTIGNFIEGTTVPPPYWSQAWAASQALARHVIENRWQVRGRRVLDFMAASGIVGIAAAQVGAAEVEAFDPDLLARAAIAANARANAVTVTVVDDDPMAADEHARWDVILVGDAGYEPSVVERCLPWLRERAAEGAMVLLADPGGSYGDAEGMVRLGDYTIPTAPDYDERASRHATVYRVAG